MNRLLFVLGAIFLGGCSIITSKPDRKTSEQRFEVFPTANLPLRDSVSVYWNEYKVPFIEANNDMDAAFMLGITHAHLRLAQMELFRMIAWGRLAEMIGPLAADIDHSLRTLQLQRSTHLIEETDDPFTVEWLRSYVDGVNWYVANSSEKPIEYKMLNITPQEWSVKDVYAISRILSADLTWGIYFQVLSFMDKPQWDETWSNFLENGSKSIPSFPKDELEFFSYILEGFSKSGSNSLAVAGSRTENGNALMVSDPHLGIFAPNMWLLVGYKSPTFHSVGMQFPGIPVMLLGRNPYFAWGGTNMRALSSHIYRLNDSDLVSITSKPDTIKVRWWRDRKIELRESEFGTIISDAPILGKEKRTIALNWLGHKPTYEVTAFLRSNMAKNFDEFKAAFNEYQVSGQNMLYADEQGNIGQVLAYGQPILKYPEKTLSIIKETSNPVTSVRLPSQQPFLLNPSQGFIASANNLPVETDIPIAFQFTGYSRMERMAWYFNKDKVSLNDMMALQLDTYSIQNIEIRDYIVNRVQTVNQSVIQKDSLVWKTIQDWDGNYLSSSRGPVAFEVFAFRLAELVYADLIPDKDLRKRYFDGEYWAWDLRKSLEGLTNYQFVQMTTKAYKKSIGDFKKYDDWGEMHRLKFGPPQSMLPIVGKRFVLNEQGVNGTSHTINKTAHEFTASKHRIGYGSNSRHISDLGDRDANFFVLLGGQDGWTSSPHNNDQFPLWFSGEYFQFPLNVETVRKKFTHRVFKFGGAGSKYFASQDEK